MNNVVPDGVKEERSEDERVDRVGVVLFVRVAFMAGFHTPTLCSMNPRYLSDTLIKQDKKKNLTALVRARMSRARGKLHDATR